MNQPLFEACVDSYESCEAAWLGGADRLELCAHLTIGGTTPSPILVQQVKRANPIAINVLIRPRFGDFLYTEKEMDMMCEEIEIFKNLGVNGVVIGALTPEGTLDEGRMQRMMQVAGSLEVTLHRAFDMTRDPFATLEMAKKLGIKTILTSGQQNNALAGKALLKQLLEKTQGEISIMAGCGVKKENIGAIHADTGIKIFHGTARCGVIDSGMQFRRTEVSMGLPSLSEYEIWRTDKDEVRLCVNLVHSL